MIQRIDALVQWDHKDSPSAFLSEAEGQEGIRNDLVELYIKQALATTEEGKKHGCWHIA